MADEALDAGLRPRAPGVEGRARDDCQQRQREGDDGDDRDDEQRPAGPRTNGDQHQAAQGDDPGETRAPP